MNLHALHVVLEGMDSSILLFFYCIFHFKIYYNNKKYKKLNFLNNTAMHPVKTNRPRIQSSGIMENLVSPDGDTNIHWQPGLRPCNKNGPYLFKRSCALSLQSFLLEVLAAVLHCFFMRPFQR
jgi:hypothetical protein